MIKFTCLVVCVLAVALNGVYSITEEEKTAFREVFKPIMTECSESHGVSEDEIKTAEKASNADGINPCFMGCVFKKTKVINDQGLFDLDKSLSHLKEYVKGEEDIAKFEEIGNKCLPVNDEAVSDGEAGCERAKLLVTCFLQNKGEIPL